MQTDHTKEVRITDTTVLYQQTSMEREGEDSSLGHSAG